MRDVKAGNLSTSAVPAAVPARQEAKRTHAKFADMLGVSERTLQQWEQGRREPTGAARVLIEVARRNPKLVRTAAKSLQALEAA